MRFVERMQQGEVGDGDVKEVDERWLEYRGEGVHHHFERLQRNVSDKVQRSESKRERTL